MDTTQRGIIEANAEPSRVTVYADRALVARRFSMEAPEGALTLRFGDLPADTDPSSVQVRGEGGFILRDVRVASCQRTKDLSAERNRLMDERSGYEDTLAELTDKLRLASDERQFLSDMAKGLCASKREQNPIDPATWAALTDFYRERLAALDASSRMDRKRESSVKAELERVDRELSVLGATGAPRTLQAVLAIEAQSPGPISVELSYLVYGPTWRPDYVLRAEPAELRVKTLYRAFVSQSTGEAWNGVELSLSTASPVAGGQAPELEPWYLNLAPPPLPMTAAKSMAFGASRSEGAVEMMAASPAPMYHEEAQASTNATSVLFTVPGRTSVGSDNQERSCTIAALDLPATFSWEACPKLSEAVYFSAELSNDTDMPLLPGSTHVYVDGSFVADGALPLVAPRSSFRTGMGADGGVLAKKVFVRSNDESSGLGARKNRTVWEYRLELKNATNHALGLRLRDQLPVSLNEQIAVKLLAPAYAKDTESLRKLTGDILEWNLKLAAGESMTIPFSYWVEYPKGVEVSGL